MLEQIKGKKFTSYRRLFTVIVLVAGVYYYKLPDVTVDEALGLVSLATLVGVLIKWVK